MTFWSKALVFTVVMGSAIALGAYTLVQGIPCSAQGEASLVGARTPINYQPVRGARKPGPRRQPAPASPVSVPAATVRLGSVSLGSLSELKHLAAEKQMVFLVLPGREERANSHVSQEVGMLVGRLAAQGSRIGALTLRGEAQDYRKLVRAFGINQFPAVVVVGGGCVSSALIGEITPEGLAQAFVVASNAASSCTASGGAACCPPKK